MLCNWPFKKSNGFNFRIASNPFLSHLLDTSFPISIMVTLLCQDSVETASRTLFRNMLLLYQGKIQFKSILNVDLVNARLWRPPSLLITL